MTQITRLVAIGPRLGSNGLGRVYSMWRVARVLGWDFQYVTARTDDVWAPLADDREFAACFDQVDEPGARLARVEAVLRHGSAAAVVFKNLPVHLAIAQRLVSWAPVIVDIDEPEVESLLGAMTTRARLGIVNPVTIRRRTHPWQMSLAIRRTHRFRITLSNPALTKLYAGTVVPHVRSADVPDASPRGASTRVDLCFVGTPKPHKGLAELRAAAAMLANYRDICLTVTAEPPRDAQPWERWVGATTLDEGRRLVAASTLVALPSRPGTLADFQFPVKLVDALHAGKPLVITPLAPLQWAAADAAVVVPPNDPTALASAIRAIADDPALAARLADRARQRAQTFTPEAAAGALQDAVESAVSLAAAGGPPRRSRRHVVP